MRARTCGGLKFRPRAFWLVAISIAAGVEAAAADDTAGHPAPAAGPAARGSVETVWFTGRQQMPVRVVRGNGAVGSLSLRREVLTFGGGSGRVIVLRGVIAPASLPGAAKADDVGRPRTASRGIDPADRARSQLTILGGGAAWNGVHAGDPFGIAGREAFERIAEAVHGVESRYGTDLRMWRLDDPDGPQGPMQISAAAAFDVGGGDRFDVYENMLIGRAYLARLFRRYGNWPDTLAAYNWGSGNADQWIARGRKAEQLPAETVRYIERVLRRALVGSVAETLRQRAANR